MAKQNSQPRNENRNAPPAPEKQAAPVGDTSLTGDDTPAQDLAPQTPVASTGDAQIEKAPADSQDTPEAPAGQPTARGLSSSIAYLDEAGFTTTQADTSAEVLEEAAAPAAVQGVTRAPNVYTGIADLDLELDAASPLMRATFAQLGEYAKIMRPGNPVVEAVGGRQQATLFHCISTIINKSGGEFRAGFAALLRFFDAYKNDALAETHLYRFMDTVPLNETDRKAFLRLVNLLKITANPKGRAIATKQVDFPKSLEFGVQEQGRQRILGFFDQ